MRSEGVERIRRERERQIEVEGWTPEHDAHHHQGDLAVVGATYALPDHIRESVWRGPFNRGIGTLKAILWPVSWSTGWWKPSPDDRIKELTKAGALIAAEIDRLLGEEQT